MSGLAYDLLEHLYAVWCGDLSLPKTYWLYGVLASVLLNLPGIIMTEYPLPNTPLMAILLLLYLAFTVVYSIFIAVAIWRSATKYTGSIWWAGLAKVAVVFGVLRFLSELAKVVTGQAS